MTDTTTGMLEGRTILVTGVLTDQSIAFHIARLAQEQGATVILSSFGRALSLTKRAASRLPQQAEVIELDVTSPDDLASLVDRLRHQSGNTGAAIQLGRRGRNRLLQDLGL